MKWKCEIYLGKYQWFCLITHDMWIYQATFGDSKAEAQRKAWEWMDRHAARWREAA